MISILLSNPLAFFIIFPLLLLSITLHEWAHCLVTDKLGDPTPRAKGRLTLDPRAHLDPLGTVAILLTNFGWGKPAPFDPYNLKNPVKDAAIIAAAGPAANMIIAICLAVILRSGLISASSDVFAALYLSLSLNLGLAIFNLIPVGPLDGAKIVLALLPAQTALEYEEFMQRYGLIVLGLLIFPWAGGDSPVNQLVHPIVIGLLSLLV